MTDPRRPVHLVALLGASAGIYAVSLAGVTFLQSSADQALTDARAPLGSATSVLTSGHDSLETDLARAERAYGDAAAGYDLLTPRLDGMETSLDALAGSVSNVTGAAQALPAHVALPKVVRSVSTSTASTTRVKAKAPATHAKSGASGGG